MKDFGINGIILIPQKWVNRALKNKSSMNEKS